MCKFSHSYIFKLLVSEDGVEPSLSTKATNVLVHIFILIETSGT